MAYTGNAFETLMTSNGSKTVEAYLVEDQEVTDGLKNKHVKYVKIIKLFGSPLGYILVKTRA